MFRKMHLQLTFVSGERISDVTLANDPATSSTQGEMDLSSLLRLCIADFPTLSSGKDQIQPRVFHHKQHLRGTPQGTSLASQFLLLSSGGVAAVANGSFGTDVAAVANDSFGTDVATVANDSFGTDVAAVANDSFCTDVAAGANDSAASAIYHPFQIC